MAAHFFKLFCELNEGFVRVVRTDSIYETALNMGLLRAGQSGGDGNLQVPGRLTCADQDYYLMEPVGREGEGLLVIPEDHIIGRAFLIVYSHEPGQSLWDGWRTDRFFAYFQ